MTVAEGVAIGLGFLAIVAPDFWPKMPKSLSYTIAGIGLCWLAYSLVMAIENGSGMKLHYGPLAAIIIGVVFVGAGIFWHISRLDNQPAVGGVHGQPANPMQPAASHAGIPPPITPNARELAGRTPRQLLALYEGKTVFQADKLIEAFKGLWVEAESRVLNILPDGPGRSIVVLKDEKDTIECRFGPQWSNAVARLDIGDTLRVFGKISDNQNGSQLYLLECEVIPTGKQGQADTAGAIELALIENPERVKASPLYIKLNFRFNPETGSLGPLDRVERGREEFQRVFEQAKTGSFEAYLIAGHLSEWLTKNARLCYASAKGFHDVLQFVEARMDELHEKYHGLTSTADDKISLVRAAREVFSATHKMEAAKIAGIEGLSVDGIVRWYCDFLVHVCEVQVWAVHPASNAQEGVLDLPHQRLLVKVDNRFATLEDKQTGIAYTEPRIKQAEVTRAIDRMKTIGI
jgi:hypothetical protein